MKEKCVDTCRLDWRLFGAALGIGALTACTNPLGITGEIGVTFRPGLPSPTPSTAPTSGPGSLTGWSMSSPANGTTSSDSSPIFTANGTEDGAVISLYTESSCLSSAIDSATVTGGTVTLTPTLSGDGAYSFYYQSVATGGSSTCLSSTLGYTLDTTAPILASASISNSSPTNTTTYSLTYGAITGTYASYCILENSTTVGSCSWTAGTVPASFTVSATENAKVLSVWLKDSAENISSRVDTGSVTLDTTAPGVPSALALVTPASSPSSNTTPVIRVSGVASGLVVKLFTSSSCTVPSLRDTVTASAATADLTSSTLTPDGTFDFYATATDAAGNSSACSTATLAYVLDTTAPALASASISNSSPTTTTTYSLTYGAITGTYASYCILENSTTVGSCTWTAGTVPASFTVSSTENAKVLSVWLKDSAGNISSRVDTGSVTLDTTAPALASAAISNSSPTNTTTYSLSYGAITGTYASYCILENSTTVGSCSWTAGTVPASFTVSSTENAKVLSVWLKDSAGNISSRVDTGSVTLDTTAPVLASAAISNSSPTNTTTYSLTYGAITGTYASYCILENSTTVGSCSWTAGTVPASFTVSSTENAKVLSVWLKDSADNISTRVDTGSVTLDTTAPSVAITSPAANTNITSSNNSATFAVSGTCDENGRTVSVKVDGTTASGQVGGSCNGTTWSATIDTTAMSCGARALTAVLSDVAGNSTTSSSVSITKFAAFTLSRNFFTYKEAGTAIGNPITITRDVSGCASSVVLTSSSVTAISGTHFTAKSLTVNFASGSLSQTVDATASGVEITNRAGTIDSDRYFTIALSSPGTSGELGAITLGQVNILDADVPGDFLFGHSFVSVNESSSPSTVANLTVQRTSTAAATSVEVQFDDATAVKTSATDYTGTTQTINFAIGVDEASVDVPITDNTGSNINRSFFAKLVPVLPSATTPPTTKVRPQSVAKIRIVDRGNSDASCNSAGNPFGGGTGASTGNPYLICSLAQLARISANSSNHFKLSADLIADATITPITSFSGTFDGNERILYGFNYIGTGTGDVSKGYFTGMAPTSAGNFVKNFNMLYASVTNVDTSSGILSSRTGTIGGTTNHGYYFENVYISGYLNSLNATSVSGVYGSGMLAGFSGSNVTNADVHIKNTLTNGVVTGTGPLSGFRGIFTGSQTPADASITNSYNTASIIASSGNAAGLQSTVSASGTYSLLFTNAENRGYVSGTGGAGIIGQVCGNGCNVTFNISQSSNYGIISGASGFVGTTGGSASGRGPLIISNSTNFGDVTGTGSVGGFSAFRDPQSGSAAYGISVTGNKNYGSISGTTKVGGILGWVQSFNADTTAASVTNNANYGNVTSSTAGAQVGGIAGNLGAGNTTPVGLTWIVTGNTNTGTISGVAQTGGIVGYYNLQVATVGNPSSTNFENNTNSGSVTATTGPTGGVVGQYYQTTFHTTRTFTGNSNSGTISGATKTGGVVGYVNGAQSTFTGTNTGAVTGTSPTGGLIGQFDKSGATTLVVSNSYSKTGTVTGSGAAGVGGLIGYVNMTSTAEITISSSYSQSPVVGGTGTGIGGLIGIFQCTGSAITGMVLTKSYATGSVSGQTNVGGLIGQWDALTTCTTSSISNVYSSGTVTGTTSNVGGLVGYGRVTTSGTGVITNGYSTSTIAGAGTPKGGLFGLADAGMTSSNSYWLREAGGTNTGITSDANARTNSDFNAASPSGIYNTWNFTTIWNYPSGAAPATLLGIP